MFDVYSVDQWIEAMRNYSQYNIELYFWGGEPFCIPDTYKLLNEWTKMDHIIPGIRIDTNVFFAEKIATQCPSNKIKLNCSYHMQYHTLEEEFRKVKLLKDLDMVAMVNFVASKYNLMHLKSEYGMTVKDLIEKFAEIDVSILQGILHIQTINLMKDMKNIGNLSYNLLLQKNGNGCEV